MYKNIISITPLPEHIHIYAEYEDTDENKSYYDRIYFIGIEATDDYGVISKSPVFVAPDTDGFFDVPDNTANFVQYHFTDNDLWTDKLPGKE